jgi:hypothetical protein
MTAKTPACRQAGAPYSPRYRDLLPATGIISERIASSSNAYLLYCRAVMCYSKPRYPKESLLIDFSALLKMLTKKITLIIANVPLLVNFAKWNNKEN